MRVYIDCAVCTPRHLCCCVMSRYMCVCESQAFKTKKWTNDSGKRERVYVCACAKRAQYSAVCCVLCAWHRQQSQRDESYSLAFHSYRLYLRRYWFINMVFRSLVQSFIAYLDTHWYIFIAISLLACSSTSNNLVQMIFSFHFCHRHQILWFQLVNKMIWWSTEIFNILSILLELVRKNIF